MTEELMLAIMAMDAYNRGPDDSNRGLNVAGASIGTAEITAQLVDAAENFFALAYRWNARTVISYRGTDAVRDVASYPLAIGGYDVPQAHLAAEFYQSVAGTVGSANVELTGHSLGGGLAGFISGLYGSNATLFDNMPFELSLANFQIHRLAGLLFFSDFTNGVIPVQALQIASASGFYVAGEFLQAARALSLQLSPMEELQSFGGLQDPFTRLHSMSLLVNLLYASDNDLTDWHPIGKALVDALFDERVGSAAGFASEDIEGRWSADGKLRAAIAYSAIDEGTRPFGDKAIVAMFDDAGDLGRLYSQWFVNGSLKRSDVKSALADIIVQYAGDLAKSESEAASVAAGVVTLDSGRSTITVDLDPARWLASFRPGHDVIVGVQELLDGVLKSSWDGQVPFSLQPRSLFQASDITRVIAATKTSAATLDAAGILGGAALVGTSSVDKLTGGVGNDWLYGGAASDTLDGGRGADFFVGGRGSDFICGGDGIDSAFFELAYAQYESVKQEGNKITVVGRFGFLDEVDTLYDVEFLVFADGVTRDFSTPANPAVETRGTETQDQLVSQNDDSDLSGAGGNDTLVGKQGSDELRGGADNDTYVYRLNGGYDWIDEEGQGGSDRIDIYGGTQITWLANLDFAHDGTGTLIIKLLDNAGGDAGRISVAHMDRAAWQVETLQIVGHHTINLVDKWNEISALPATPTPTTSPVNHAPVVRPLGNGVTPGTFVDVRSLFSVADSDVGDEIVQYRFFDPVGAGQLLLNDTPLAAGSFLTIAAAQVIAGALRYQAGAEGSFEAISIAAFDGEAWSATQLSYVMGFTLPSSVPANSAPVAQDDAYSVMGGSYANLPVLANDSDANNGDRLTIVGLSGHDPRTVSIAPDGRSVIVSPPAGQDWPFRFTYMVSDGRGGQDEANVTVTVGASSIYNDPAVPFDLTWTVQSGGELILDLLSTVRDPDLGDVLSVTSIGQPAHGTLAVNGSSITYHPTPGYSGEDSISFSVTDNHGAISTFSLDLTVNGDVDARDDFVATDFNTPVTFHPLANDSDDGGSLFVESAFFLQNGTAVINSDSSVTYTPNSGFVGTDRFRYLVGDGQSGWDEAWITIAVRAADGTGGAITGTEVDDPALLGTPVGEAIFGLGGNDVILPGAGNDDVDAGTGFDTVDYSSSPVGVFATIQEPTVAQNGTVIWETSSDGYGGSDILKNAEALSGSPFDDELRGNSAHNVLLGGDGNDIIRGSYAQSTIGDELDGGPGNDTLDLTPRDNVVRGGSGDDQIIGGIPSSSNGVPSLTWGPANNWVDAGDDNDRVVLWGTSNTVLGGAGNDFVRAGGYVDAGSGDDDVGESTSKAFGDTTPPVSDDEWHLGEGNDRAVGGIGYDRIYGEGGDDQIFYQRAYQQVDPASDFFDGGDGFDTFSFSVDGVGAPFHAFLDLSIGLVRFNDGTFLQAVNFERFDNWYGDADVLGSASNDAIWVRDGIGTLDGRDGDDNLVAYTGGFTFIGGEGADIIDPGADGTTNNGARFWASTDRIVYNSVHDAGDTITSYFQTGVGGDIILLSGLLETIGYAGSTPFADGYLRLVATGAGTELQVDADGISLREGWLTLATIGRNAYSFTTGNFDVGEAPVVGDTGGTSIAAAYSLGLVDDLFRFETVWVGPEDPGDVVALDLIGPQFLRFGFAASGGAGIVQITDGSGTLLDTVDVGTDAPVWAAAVYEESQTIYLHFAPTNPTVASTISWQTQGVLGDQVIVGTLAADTIDDVVSAPGQALASASADKIFSLAGNDEIAGIGGDDFISGGAGYDTVRYSGNRADYRIDEQVDGRSIYIADLRSGSPDGTDTIIDVEAIKFADGIVPLADLVNYAPKVSSAIVNQTTTEDATWSYQLLPGVFFDVDGDSLVYSAALSDGSPLPAWLIFDAATQTFSMTSTNNFNGDLDIAVQADDGEFAALDTFHLLIAPVNDSPTVGLPATAPTTTEEQSVTIYDFAVDDVEGDILSVSLTAAGVLTLAQTAGLSFSTGDGDADRTLSFSGSIAAINSALHGMVLTPDRNASGVVQIEYTVSDGSPSPRTGHIAIDVSPTADAPLMLLNGTPQSLGNEFRINTHIPLAQEAPAISPGAGGGFVVVWQSLGQGEPSLGQFGQIAYGVFGQRLDGSGNLVGSEFGANRIAYDDQGIPAVAGLTNGDFAVTWVNGSSSPMEVRIRTFGSDAFPYQDYEFHANTDAFGYGYFRQELPAVASLANGDYVVVWEQAQLSGKQVFATVPGHGVFRVNETPYIGNPEWSELAADVAGLPDGGFVVVWSGFSGEDASGNGVRGRRYDANSNPTGLDFQINTWTENHQIQPAVTALASGGFVVTWLSLGQDGNAFGVFAQLFDAIGDRIGGEFRVNVATEGDQRWQSIAALPDGGFIVAWASLHDSVNSADVYAQRFDGSGTRIGHEFRINTTLPLYQYDPSIAVDENGNIIVVWTSDGQDGSGYGIYGQRLVLPDLNAAISGTEDLTVELPEIVAGVRDLDDSESIHLVLSGFPVGSTFSVGALATAGADAGKWLIANPLEIAALATTPLTMSPAANFSGNFVLTIQAVATDTAALSSGSTSSVTSVARTVNLTVAPVYDAPIDVIRDGTALAENSAVGTIAGTLRAIGADPSYDTAFTLLDDANGLFYLDGSNIILGSPLDYEVSKQHSIEIEAEDDHGNTLRRVVSIAIRDENDNAPVFTTNNQHSVVENSMFVTALASTDIDTVGSNPATFVISGGVDAALFSIVDNNLVFNVAPDYETQAHIRQVEITASDGTNSVAKTIVVNVSNLSGTFTGDAAPNLLTGTSEEDVIAGRAGNDVLQGEAGNDLIVGGTGRDVMRGGPGRDVFDFNSRFETGVTSSTRDIIIDFLHSSDKIDLLTVDASSSRPGNNVFAWRGQGPITSSASGELRSQKFDNPGTTNDYTIIFGDTDSDAAIEFQIKLIGLINLTAGDFVF